MRRSSAPSMKNNAKRFCSALDSSQNTSVESYSSDPEDEFYRWGSKGNPEVVEKEQLGNCKRIFNIVWREVSTKKNKTWKGDGTLEVNIQTMKAVAKDEAGKYLGCSTKFILSDLQEDFQMQLGGKEIEIQNEIKDEEEIYELRRMQVKNRNWGEEEYMTPELREEERKKPKSNFRFKPLLMLKPLALGREKSVVRNYMTNNKNNTDSYKHIHESSDKNSTIASTSGSKSNSITSTVIKSNSITSTSFIKNSKTFICFLKASELQQYLFQQLRDFYINHKTLENLQSLDMTCVLKQICNHPSFIKYSKSDNKILEYILPFLPHWSDMGPFDSGKLEFVKYFIESSMSNTKQKSNIIIMAKNVNVLNMIQGLCDFMHIPCLRLNSNDPECEEKNITKTRVILLNDINKLKSFSPSLSFSGQHRILVFDNVSSYLKEIGKFSALDNPTIYYLVTAFSIEELMLLPSYQYNQENPDYKELLDLVDMEETFCYTHIKIRCYCNGNNGRHTSNEAEEDFQFFSKWQHLASPFNEEFFKVSDLENCSSNIVSVFYKINK